MRDIDSIKPDVAPRQRGAKAGRLAVLASTLLGFTFLVPQTSTGQTRPEHDHVTMTTGQAFEYAGLNYAGSAVEEWAVEADDDDLELALDATQILEAAHLTAFLADQFGVRMVADTASRLVADLRYYKRFAVMPPRPLRTPAFEYPRGFNYTLGQLDRRINYQQVSIK